MAYELIEVRTEGGKVGIVTLNRPKQLNALNNELMDELGAALKAFDADPSIGCMIITGSEKAFAAGADIGAMAGYSFADVYKGDYITRNWETIRSIRKPVIAAVSGFALGGGCELAMMCDFIIAADNAKFGQPEIKLGIIPGAGGTQRLPRAVGKAKAMDMALTARMMDAAEAERVGPGQPRRAAGQADGRGAGRGADDLRVLADRRDGGQGVGEPLVRKRLVGRRDVRAPAVPRAVRHGRPEGRHGRLRQQAQGAVQAPIGVPLI